MQHELKITLTLTGTVTVNGGIEVPFDTSSKVALEVCDKHPGDMSEAVLTALKNHLADVVQDAVDVACTGQA